VGLALNLGCGKRPDGRGQIPFGMDIVNHDQTFRYEHVDVAWDLRDHPWPWPDEMFDYVLAYDVIEHLIDTIAFVDECWRILKVGKVLVIHTNNVEFLEQAWRSPSHKKVFTIDTFDFFDPQTKWGSEYPESDYPWELKHKVREGLELKFCLKKRAL